MPTEFAGWSRPNARFTGIIYLLYFVTAIGGELFLRGIVIPGDADSTARNLLAHQWSFQAGVAIGLASTAGYLALTGLLYRLFAPVIDTFLRPPHSSVLSAAPFSLLLPCFAFCPSHYS